MARPLSDARCSNRRPTPTVASASSSRTFASTAPPYAPHGSRHLRRRISDKRGNFPTHRPSGPVLKIAVVVKGTRFRCVPRGTILGVSNNLSLRLPLEAATCGLT